MSMTALAAQTLYEEHPEKRILDTGDDLTATRVGLLPSDLVDTEKFGIEQLDVGVVEDTHENRKALNVFKNDNLLDWMPGKDVTRERTGHLIVFGADVITRTRTEMLTGNLAFLLEDPDDINSDYRTDEEFVLEQIEQRGFRWPGTPPYLVKWLRWYHQEMTPGQQMEAAHRFPSRCAYVLADGVRCIAWSDRTRKSRGSMWCKLHGRLLTKPEGEEMIREQARRTLLHNGAVQSADRIVHLALNSPNDHVSLKAATEVLDRVGIRGGKEVDVTVAEDTGPAAEKLRARLERLSETAQQVVAENHSHTQGEVTAAPESETAITDAEVVEDETGAEAP